MPIPIPRHGPLYVCSACGAVVPGYRKAENDHVLFHVLTRTMKDTSPCPFHSDGTLLSPAQDAVPGGRVIWSCGHQAVIPRD